MANELSKIKMPSGTEYSIKDATARQQIQNIQTTITGAMHYRGITTTEITDNSTTATLVISGENVTFNSDSAGAVVIYGNKEYVWNGSKWQEFGSTGSLKALAFKDNASATYTPAGTVSKPTFQGTESTVTITATESSSGSFQFGGSVGVPAFNGASMTSTGTFKPTGSVTITQETTGTTNFTPSGTVAAPTITLTESDSPSTTIKNPTSVTVAKTIATAAPGSTAPANAVTMYSVSGETLSLYQVGYTTGASITTSNVSVKKGDASYSASSSAPKFTGTATVISAQFNGTQGNVSVSGTTTGSNSAPTFTGKKYNISGKTTATGNVSQPTFSGTEATITVS